MGGWNPDEYQAVRESAGLIDLRDRGKIAATGPDRVSFLHNMISNDVEQLSEYAGRHSTFLTAQGKIVAEFYVYKFPDQLLLDLHPEVVEKTISTLGRYIIMDDVELAGATSDWAHFSIQGPRSAEMLSSLAQLEIPSKHLHISQGKWQSGPLWAIHKADLAEVGFEVLLPAVQGDLFRHAILHQGQGRGLREVGQRVRHILRVEAGIPLQGAELDESRYPMEARLEDALSFDKGCYIGQEVVAKATYIGGVARLLVRLQLDGPEVPAPGSALIDPGGKKLGSLTSSAYSPSLKQPIALGYVKKKFAQPGQRLLASPPQGKPIACRVVEQFLSSISR